METNIQKYIAFAETIKHGSFTKAAEHLNYSQSGISRMIADLEKEWNITLLERNKSGIKPTSDGLKLLPYIQNICSDFENLKTEIDQLSGLESGLIRIGTFSSVATHWLPNIIKEFQKDYPNIDYELLLGDYTEIEDWIHTGRVDCGFLRLPTNNTFKTIFLKEDKLMVILPENHPLKDCEKIPVSALCDEPFLLLEKGAKSEVTEIFENNNLTPDIKFTTWDDYAIMSMVESGLGISILPELILKQIPYKIITKELDIPAYRNIGLAFRNEKSSPLAVKKFVEYLRYR